MEPLSRRVNTIQVRESDVEKNGRENASIYFVPRKGKLRLIKDYLIEYTENSNLHGFRYIGEKKRTAIEKIFWALMIACSVVLCAILIHKIWVKWNNNPVIVTFAENSTPAWQIPYPAVTVCSTNKVIATRYNYTKYYHLYFNSTTRTNLTQEETDKFEHISMVCGTGMPHTEGKNFSFDCIKEVFPSNSDFLRRCSWHNKNKNCMRLFTPVLTENGLCYTFNIIDAADLFRKENLHSEYEYLEDRNTTIEWSLENGYKSSAPLKTFPRRGTHGLKSGLNLLLFTMIEWRDHLCASVTQGFNILLHNPLEVPRVSQHSISIPLSHEILIAVKPKIITSSEGIRIYDAERRQCYFQDERDLLYFRNYTQNNCEVECLANFTYARCGCIHFTMPRGPNMKACDASMFRCIRASQKELEKIEIKHEMEKHTKNHTAGRARTVAKNCNCLPACTSIDYEAETSLADYDLSGIYTALNIRNFDEKHSLRYSRVRIYLKEAQFITSRRSELYGQTDFLANCGGLLGLFMGFSILSVAEFIYFLTLRLWCVLRRYRRKNSLKTNVPNSKAKLAFD